MNRILKIVATLGTSAALVLGSTVAASAAAPKSHVVKVQHKAPRTDVWTRVAPAKHLDTDVWT